MGSATVGAYVAPGHDGGLGWLLHITAIGKLIAVCEAGLTD